jgi:hypothetical protein
LSKVANVFHPLHRPIECLALSTEIHCCLPVLLSKVMGKKAGSEAIDAGNRDFQFSPVDQLGEFSQDRRPRRLSVSHGLDAILCRSRKVGNRLDPFRSDAQLEGEFDVIGTEGIDKGVEVIAKAEVR